MSDIVHPNVTAMAVQVRDIIATYQDAEDLITIGAYKPGQNKRVDRAVALIDQVNNFLKQKSGEKTSIEESWKMLHGILTAQPV